MFPQAHILKSLPHACDIKRYQNLESWALVARFILLQSGSRILPLLVGMFLSHQGKMCPSAIYILHDVLLYNKPKSCLTDNLLNVRQNNLLVFIWAIHHNTRKLTLLRIESCGFSSLLMLSSLHVFSKCGSSSWIVSLQ